MRKLAFFSLFLIMAGCSSTKVLRTAANDPLIRVLVSPDTKPEDYLEVRDRLFATGKFELVERRDLTKIFDEQNLQYRSGNSERFDPREKYMMIGKLTGARGIVLVNSTCHQGKNFWGTYTNQCRLYLTLIDGFDGQVKVSVQGESDEPWSGTGIVAKNWQNTIDRFVSEYPKYFVPKPIDPSLEQYKQVSEELSKREAARSQQSARTPASNQSLQQDILQFKQKSLEMNNEVGN